MKILPLAVLMLAVLLGGCAVFQQNEATQTEKWLLQAGFREMKADTPQKLAALSRMTPYKIESKVDRDKVLYRYVNPETARIYIGGPKEFAAYKQIAVSAKARRASNLAQITPLRTTGPLVW